jgi:FKBP-type peptidyl-prolyl cis-trans isomerase SlyD
MHIEKDKVVAIGYTLKNEGGEVIDSSQGGEPLSFIQGNGNLIPGLENALEGKSTGDRVEVTVPPETGYGVRDEALVLSVERAQFAEVKDLQEGFRFRMDTPDGPEVFTVVKIDESQVLVDGNHPLAGMTLDFDTTIQSVRDATVEELEHGHVHE